MASNDTVFVRECNSAQEVMDAAIEYYSTYPNTGATIIILTNEENPRQTTAMQSQEDNPVHDDPNVRDHENPVRG